MQLTSLRKLALGIALAVTLSVPTWAQTTTQGAISGTTTDATGAVVPNAAVLIHSDDTGADLNLTTDSTGFYKAPQLAPGSYTITVKAPGFGDLKSTGVVVQVQTVTEVSPHLVAGSTESVVEVTAEVPVLKFDTPEFGGHLSTQEIQNIPINNRRWSALALTTPGVTNDASGFGLLSFRAISAVLNNVQIDGADDNQAFFGEERGRTRAGYSTAQSAVREFQVNTGVYSAEFGRAVGGVVNSVTKSGTNQLHGEAFFYNRNSSRSAYVPLVTNTTYNATTGNYVTAPYKPKDNRNQFGFGVGGPLLHDRLFWYYTFDEYHRNFPGTAKANNPNSFFVNIAATDAAATTLSQRLSSAGIATSAAQAATLYNTHLTALLGNLGSVPRYGHQDINTPKLSWQITPKHNASILYHRLRWDSPGGVQTQATNNYAVDTFGTDFVKLDYTVAKLNSIINDHFVNELRYQYGRELNNEGNQPSSAYTKQYLLNSNGIAPEIALNTSVGFFMGMPYYGFRVAYPDERKWQIGDSASYSFGKHNVRFGIDFVHNYDLQNNLYEGNGYVNYTSTLNYVSDVLAKGGLNGGKTCNSAGSGVGSAAAGYYPCYSFYANGFGPSVFELSTMDYAFFVQDDWKVTPRLTLNLGARYDYEAFPQPFAGISGTAGGTLPVTSSRPSDKNNIAPRIGFAYDPFGLGKTVVRGGFGIFYGRVPNSAILNAYENTGSPNSQSTPNISPTTVGAPTLSTPPTSAPAGTATAYYLDAHMQSPYTQQFDLAVQQNIGFNNVLSVSYLGALGRELPNFINYNIDPTKSYTVNYTLVPATGQTTCGPAACGTYQVKAYAGKLQTGASTSQYTNIALNPNYGSITGVVSNINSNYHALSVDVTNRSNKWVQFDANYTWAHALDFSQNQFTAPSVNNWIDPYANPRVNYGNSSLNIRHRAVGWANFMLPGLSTGSAIKYITNGWSIKPYVQLQSGLPYSVGYTGSAPNQCYAAGCLQAFSSTGISGTNSSTNYIPFIGRNTNQYPRTILVDARIQKDFKLHERYTLQLLGEAFNLANHRNVTGLNTTAYTLSTNQTTNVNTMTFNASTYGSITSANSNYAYNPRLIQIAARFVF